MLDEGKLVEAEPYLRDGLEKSRRVLGNENDDTLTAINGMGGLLVAQGKQAEAIALLAPAEVATRKAFPGDNAFRLASFLMHLGKARSGLGEFAAAEPNLLEAHDIFARTQPPRYKRDLRDCIQAIVDLYASWNAAERGKSYDTKAAEWKMKLDELGPPTPAAAAH